MLSPSPKSFHKIIVINNRNILVVASIDILSELFRFSFVLYSETRKTKRRKTNVKLQNRKTDYSTQKQTSLKSPVHRLTTKYNLSIQPPPGGFFMFQVGAIVTTLSPPLKI